MDNAAVVGGLGVVGAATAKLFGIKKIFDIADPEGSITLKEAAKCKFVFICLPTPVKEDGSYNTQDILAIIRQLEDYGGAGIYIIRSTVSPGFARIISEELGINRIVSNPEFLSEDTAEKDTKNPPFVLLGGIPRYVDDVKAIYQGRVKAASFIVTDNTTAEMAKLAMNGYFATKVIYANQMHDACQKLGANYERVREVLESHPYGPRNHFRIWYKGKRGVAGKCLPKDTKALAHYSGSEIVQKVLELNENYIYMKENE